jgi:hypothetical protein
MNFKLLIVNLLKIIKQFHLIKINYKDYYKKLVTK